MANGEYQHQDFRFLAQNDVRSNTRLESDVDRIDLIGWKVDKKTLVGSFVCSNPFCDDEKNFVMTVRVAIQGHRADQ